MSASQPPPSLEDYPGFFPAAKPPFWTKAKVGATTGICGLLLGITGTASGGTDDSGTDRGYSQAELDKAVDEARGEAVATFEGDADARVTALEEELADAESAQKQAVAKAVEKAVAAERARRAAAAPVRVPQLADVPSGGGGTDPRFGTCGEANDNGYGPYVSGADPEYDWYTDRDNDGRVCER